jgi:formylglycine-generating enzyme required for sulfatase activity
MLDAADPPWRSTARASIILRKRSFKQARFWTNVSYPYPEPCGEGFARADNGNCYPIATESDADTDTDTDTDSDTDSDTDTDTDTDTDADADSLPDTEGMVRIAAGSFDMGCTPGQAASHCSDDAYPVHTVTLSRDFWIGETEVTRGQFRSVWGSDPSYQPCGDDCPVQGLRWDKMAAYANVLSEEQGFESCYVCTDSYIECELAMDPYECMGYRLPTEAEWEFAARCGTDLLYAGSDSPHLVGWFSHEYGEGASIAVASFAPNDCGLYDMSGNVYEWTGDWYDPEYYSISPATDPSGPSSGTERVRRGGSGAPSSVHPPISYRGHEDPDFNNAFTGFRLVRNAD